MNVDHSRGMGYPPPMPMMAPVRAMSIERELVGGPRVVCKEIHPPPSVWGPSLTGHGDEQQYI